VNTKAKKYLIVTDGLNKKWINLLPPHPDVFEASLLPLGIGAAAYYQENLLILKKFNVKIVPATEIAEAARKNIQNKYPQFIFDLAKNPIEKNESLLDILSLNWGNMWWLMETSEKSVFRCSLVNHLYFLELVALAWAQGTYDEIWLDIECQSLKSTLQSMTPSNKPFSKIVTCNPQINKRLPSFGRFLGKLLITRLYIFFRMIFQKFLLRIINFPTNLPNFEILICGVFPVMWSNPFGEHPTDRTYGILADVLKKWKPTGYLGIIQLPIRMLWKNRKQIKNIFSKLNIVPLITFGKLQDFLIIVHLSHLRKIIRADRALRKVRVYKYGDFNILPLIIDELHCSLSGSELPLDLLWMRCIKNLTQKTNLDFLIHWGEFQPIDKAFWYGTRSTNTKTVSFQHSTCTPMFLSYQFAKNEVEEYLATWKNSLSMPLPDLFVTTGHYASQVMEKAGFPKERIKTVGAVRFRGLIDLRLSMKSIEQNRLRMNLELSGKIILLAASSKVLDNITMAKSLALALRKFSDTFTIIIKCHPLLPREKEKHLSDLITKTNLNLKCIIFPQEHSLHDLISISDVMVSNSSATGLEAMALGVMPIFFHNPYLYDLSVLYSLSHSILLASSEQELSQALDGALYFDETLKERKAHWEDDIKWLFYQIDTQAEERFLSFLQEHYKNASHC